jgi:arylsulfatase A-like enzyme
MAAELKKAGYATASIGKWHLGKPPFDPQHHGFDLNFAGEGRGSPASYFYPYNGPDVKTGEPGEYLTDRLTDEALKFIEQRKDKPFFLYLPHYAVHAPFQAKPELIRKYQDRVRPDDPQNSAVYGAMVESSDQSVGRILNKLDELGIADHTVVIFTSDNGGLIRATANGPWRNGKGTLYEGGVRVPLIIRWPGGAKPGTVCDMPVMTIDFFSTMLDMAGVSAGRVDGESIVPLLRRGKPPKRDTLYWHYPHYHQPPAAPSGAIRCGDFKLIEFYEDGRVELYNLKDDPGEQRDLVSLMPERAAELRRRFHQWLKEVNAQMPTPNPDYKPAG